jgi:hypothetical protein
LFWLEWDIAQTTRSRFVIPSEPRISYYAAPEMATCAVPASRDRMKFADPNKLDRKSGEAESLP